ncbi:HigA family addiction module antitoxin [uncultured Erythrobacter sp.]|uniref:HigA family addiction module antitoxin n=1 Tax=uncultured Erythrobacter sp. TaxID=263913 RepID=UPI0026212EB4|nr:HigA family addiction module antitoxin [uncultured Erythrobacter sp.]
MADKINADFSPDWAVHPGEFLEEYIEALGFSQAELARRADLTPKLVNTIIKGTNPVEARTAVMLERVTGLKAYVWTRLQDEWDLATTRNKEQSTQKTSTISAWLRKFPTQELKKRGVLPDTKDVHAQRDALLSFFGVANERAYSEWDNRFAVNYRTSASHKSSPECVRVWLQLAKRAAEQVQTTQFDEKRLLNSIDDLRSLTSLKAEVFQPRLQDICSDAGVAVVPVPPFKGTRLSGAAFWYRNDQAVIALSLRHKTNDHFWFTLFHELGHLCLHARNAAFVDDDTTNGSEVEKEADDWAEEHLVGRARFRSFMATRPKSKVQVKRFASSVGVHPGIVVGMLQHHKALPWSHMNDLKARFEFAAT